ncbi:MAG: hypothetical protein QM500_19475 [Methylococcales bacterium]
MTTPEDRHQIYTKCFELLPISRGELARLFNLGEPPTPSTRSRVSDKLNGVPGKGITKPEALAMQMLVLLHNAGVDIEKLKFDDTGQLCSLQGDKST